MTTRKIWHALYIVLMTITINVFFLQLANADEADTLNSLATLLENNDYSTFHKQAQKMAMEGNVASQFLLGKAYHLGLGVKKDETEAKKYYELAAAGGSARAMNNRGLLYLEANQREYAISWFQQALANGLEMPTLKNLCAAYDENPQYYVFQVVSCNTRLYRITPNDDILERLQSATAQVLISVLDMPQSRRPEKEKFDQIYKDALAWNQLAMDHGLKGAFHNRGAMHYVQGEYDAAISWFTQAAERGQTSSMLLLGDMAAEGKGMPKNDEISLGWNKRAAAIGSDTGKSNAIRLLAHQHRYVNSYIKTVNYRNKLMEVDPNANEIENLSQDILSYEKRAYKFQVAAETPNTGGIDMCIRLQDIPGKAGLALSNTEWYVDEVDFVPDLIHSARGNILIRGETGKDGVVRMRPAAAEKIRLAMQQGKTVSLVYFGSSVVLELRKGGCSTTSVYQLVPGQ